MQRVLDRFSLRLLTFTLFSALVAASSRADTISPLGAACDVPGVTHPLIKAAVDDTACETINLAASTTMAPCTGPTVP